MDKLSTGKWFEIDETSLTITGSPTFDEWAGLFGDLCEFHKALPWFIGDLLVQGEHRYGETNAAAVDETGLGIQTLTNYASVCRRVPRERRNPNLSFTHHALIASLDDHSQQAWLKEAETYDMRTNELRAGIKEALALQDIKDKKEIVVEQEKPERVFYPVLTLRMIETIWAVFSAQPKLSEDGHKVLAKMQELLAEV